MNILVSACLLGLDCRYCGSGCVSEQVLKLIEKHSLIPVCPEQMGGLPTPRAPVELVNREVVDSTGMNFTSQFEKGADEVVKLAKLLHCSCAVLKSRSPSCGCGAVYDGTFSGELIGGNGITAEKLLKAGVSVFSDENCDNI